MRIWSVVLVAALASIGCKKEAASTARKEAPASPTVAATGHGWLEVDPTKPIAPTLVEQSAIAGKAGKKPYAYLHADWCGPCKALQKYKDEPSMAAAFAGTHIVMIDIDRVKAPELEALGMSGAVIPVFYRLGADGKPTGDKIDGGAWGDNIPENMAPPLAAFFAK